MFDGRVFGVPCFVTVTARFFRVLGTVVTGTRSEKVLQPASQTKPRQRRPRNAEFSFLIHADVRAIGQLSEQAESDACGRRSSSSSRSSGAVRQPDARHARPCLIIGC